MREWEVSYEQCCDVTICCISVDFNVGTISVHSQKDVGTTFSFTVRVSMAHPPSTTTASHCDNCPPVQVQQEQPKPSIKVTITPPAPATAASVSPTIPRAMRPQYVVLIVEDNVMNQRVLMNYLSSKGFSCDIANNGKEAVDKYQNAHYSLIFMDMEMPIMVSASVYTYIHDSTFNYACLRCV